MSFNQSKSDKSDAAYRRSGRSASFNQQRGNTGGSYVKSGTGGAAPSVSSSRSFNKKSNNHAQGGPSRVNPAPATSAVPNYASAVRATPNGSHVHQPQFHGGSDASVTNASAKPSESSAVQKSTGVVSKAPISQPPSVSSGSAAPTTPAKDASKAFPFQFGSLSPGVMNVMAIPARTNSAPPNFDEQKRDQARHDSLRPVPSVPTPPVPKQQPAKKDTGAFDHKAGETHTGTVAKKDAQVSLLPPANLMQKPSVIPLAGVSMPGPYHQSQAPVHFGAANPQIQSHGMSTAPLQMPLPMPFPIGSAAQVQQSMFVPSLQPHPIHPQGIMHQVQNIGYSPQIGHQLPHHFGNMGMGINPQYSPQQGGKIAIPRKTTPVKITHPDTHEELRLDKRAAGGGSSGGRSYSGMLSQSQSVQSQITTNAQPPRVSRDVPNAIPSTLLGVSSVSIKPSGGSGIVNSSFANSNISGAQKGGSPSSLVTSSDVYSLVPPKGPEICSEVSSQQSTAASASSEKLTLTSLLPSSTTISEHSVSAVSNNEGRNQESLSRSNSLKDNQKKLQMKGQLQNQVAVQSSAVANKPPLAGDGCISNCGVSEILGTKTPYSAATAHEDLLAIASGTNSATRESVSSSVEEKTNGSTQVSACASAEGPVTQAVDSLNNHKSDMLDVLSREGKQLRQNNLAGDKTEISTVPISKNVSDNGAELSHLKKGASELGSGVVTSRTGLQGQDGIESASSSTDCDRTADNLGMSTSALDSKDASLSRIEGVVSNETTSTNSGTSDHQSSGHLETNLKHCKDGSEDSGTGSASLPAASVTMDKPILEPSKVKGTSKGKKKRKEILQKADASGSTADLYNAYKGPEEKKEAVASSESTANVSTSGNSKQQPIDAAQPAVVANKQCEQSKAEPEDWEDAADMSAPKLGVSAKTQQDSNGSAVTDKKYSRDFLLKFAEQCSDLPEGFEIAADIAETLMGSNIGSHVIERDSHPSTGRNTDRSGGMSRMDRRGSGIIEDDKWSKASGAFHSDMRLDGIGGSAGSRRGQGGNFGVLRNPSVQTAMQYGGGILSGPMQSMVNQGGMQRNSPDGERWQRAASFQQRGLIPSPSSQSPLVAMHKAEKKYEVGKVTDEEQAKQRQLKGILNKLTPQNFEKLFEQVKAVNIDNAVTLTGVISQIFEKALMEPTFCEMYADFCFHLAAALPDLSQDNEKITFKRLLLNKCQEEFERGEREQEEANQADEGEVKQSDEEREAKRSKARRRMLGNIRLIGELYKKRMLTERIMHECIKKLLGQCQNPDEEDIEALCKLMSTIGGMIDHPKAKEHMDVYFERIKLLSNNMSLSSRLRFMLKDTIDLRKNRWQQRRKVEGPKKIEEVHRDASQERQSQAGRPGRGMGISAARRVPMDFGSRGSSMLSPPNVQMGGLPTQVRGYGSQDVRGYERQSSYEARTPSIPLPQRPSGDESITLGPQGGLARGMSIRGSAVSNFAGLNSYSNLPERASYSPREDFTPRYIPNRSAGPTAYDQSSAQDHSMDYGNKDLRNADRFLDRSGVNSPPAQVQETAVSQNTSSEKGLSDEKLQNMSMAAIREYYSARDVNEVVLCVKDLNSPSFHPSMVSLWVTDSFERKDTHRDLLAKLLIDLVKSHGGILSQTQLIEGFESVLSTLEDVVTDAPKAPEYLGRIFAKAITEHVAPLKEIGRLIHDGGYESGSLLQIGLAADILGSTLEVIQTEKGDAFLNEIQTKSNLQLQTFMPPGPIKSRKLEKFI
ncbi:eukaryotic translation initiation factor 4G-like isoform X2 [Vicia villosa]|uniref:eukaryotic translation initiation factor 4G-like isoform X2 n=1 Tax=Vicia villosa TaxID=3911 RepID=UPI00273B6476|nr:eukaryotic translation initiation factor 4G-like isoform X2 [Vicia villosa]